MLERQDSLLSSSSRRETLPPLSLPNHRHHHHHAAKSIGCVSGIFHLLSKYQNRQKFLTLGKKQEKRDTTSKQREKEESRDVRRRFSCDVQRSPTIPPDIRRSTSVNSRKNVSSPPALLPSLEGLQEVPAAGRRPATEYYYSTSSNSSSSSEKRRKLMSDIDKCNEDLKELKKIIQIVQFPENIGRSPPQRPQPVELKRVVNVAKRGYHGEDDDTVNFPTNEQPSPVSVLDKLARSPLISTIYTRKQTTHGRMPLPQTQKLATPRKKPGEDDAFDSSFLHKVTVKSLQAKREAAGCSRPWSSKAMVESVEEVCKDIAWGEKREVGRIGLVIHDYICRDLIEEVVKEMGFCYRKYSLPLQACKRRLCF